MNGCRRWQYPSRNCKLSENACFHGRRNYKGKCLGKPCSNNSSKSEPTCEFPPLCIAVNPLCFCLEMLLQASTGLFRSLFGRKHKPGVIQGMKKNVITVPLTLTCISLVRIFFFLYSII